LQRIIFYSGLDSSSLLGDAFQIQSGTFAQQIIPVPEPETYLTIVILLLGLGIYQFRSLKRKPTPKVKSPFCPKLFKTEWTGAGNSDYF
jgi:hypothetical protein